MTDTGSERTILVYLQRTTEEDFTRQETPITYSHAHIKATAMRLATLRSAHSRYMYS